MTIWNDPKHKEWIDASRRTNKFVDRLVNNRGDITVVISPDTRSEEEKKKRNRPPGVFYPTLGRLHLDASQTLPKSLKELSTLNLNSKLAQRRYPAFTGVTVHESAHARHTLNTDAVHDNYFVNKWIAALEEPRCEHKMILDYPQYIPHLKSASKHLFGEESFVTPNLKATEKLTKRFEAARIAILLIGRAVAGILSDDEVSGIKNICIATFGSKDYRELHKILDELMLLEDTDCEGIVDLAVRVHAIVDPSFEAENTEEEDEDTTPCGSPLPQDEEDEEDSESEESDEKGDGSDDSEESDEKGEGSGDGEESDEKSDEKGEGEASDEESGEQGEGSGEGEASDEESDEQGEGSGKGSGDGEESDEESGEQGEGSGEGEASDEESDEQGEGSGKGPGDGEESDEESDEQGKGSGDGEASDEESDEQGEGSGEGEESDEQGEGSGKGSGEGEESDEESGEQGEGSGEGSGKSDKSDSKGKDGSESNESEEDSSDGEPSESNGNQNDSGKSDSQEPSEDELKGDSEPEASPGKKKSKDKSKGDSKADSDDSDIQDDSDVDESSADRDVSNRTISDLIKDAIEVISEASEHGDVEARNEGTSPIVVPQHDQIEEDAQHRDKAREAKQNMNPASSSGVGWGIPEVPTVSRQVPSEKDESRSRSISFAIEKAQFRDVTRTAVHSVLPPGRFNVRQAMRRSAQLSMKQEVTATPWTQILRREVDNPPITLAIASDISYSMSAWQREVSSFTWAFSHAVSHLEGQAGAVLWNDDTYSLIEPGYRPQDIPVAKAAGGSSGLPGAMLALDGLMDLSFSEGVRVLAVITDGQLPNEAEIQTIIDTLVAYGVIVLWILTTPRGWKPRNTTIAVLNTPEEFGTVVGDKVIEALSLA